MTPLFFQLCAHLPLLLVLVLLAFPSHVTASSLQGLRTRVPSFLNRVVSSPSLNTTKRNYTTHITGYDLLRRPWVSRGSTLHDNKAYRSSSVVGLVPAGSHVPMHAKVSSAIEQFRQYIRPIDKYTYLHTLQDTEEALYYALLTHHTVEVLPYVYTPTVGEACQKWSHIPHSSPRGLYISINDRGNIKNILKYYPLTDIKVIVVTDGERILGLGDLGCNGMGIPIGKLALYTACAGIHPDQCLPVHIDVGTNTPSLLSDPMYQGLKQPRVRGKRYDDLIEEFVDACQEAYGRDVLIQFEDFANSNAFRLLEKFKNMATVFNDDIQGTAAVVVSGLLSAMRLLPNGSNKLADQTFLFHGAGSAGVGVADLITDAIVAEGKGSITKADARKRIWLVDSKGLVTSNRGVDTLQSHKVPYAHAISADTVPIENDVGLLEHAVDMIKPTALLGMSAQANSFTKEICGKMAALNERPIIFALSNPTSKAECSASDAYTWTDGKAIFASGSPFDIVKLKDKVFVPGQCNNAYIFPAMGLAARVTGALKITNDDFYQAALTLSELVSTEQMQADGCLFPSFSSIRDVSLKIAVAVAKGIISSGRAVLADDVTSENLVMKCKAVMYEPELGSP